MSTRTRPYRLGRKTWRGRQGWQITGGPGAWSVSIFFDHETAARRTIGRLRTEDGFELGLEDFDA